MAGFLGIQRLPHRMLVQQDVGRQRRHRHGGERQDRRAEVDVQDVAQADIGHEQAQQTRRDGWQLMALTRSAPFCLADNTPSRPTAPSPTTATVTLSEQYATSYHTMAAGR